MSHLTLPLKRPARQAFVALTGLLALAACNPPPPDDHAFRKENPYQKEWGYEQDRMYPDHAPMDRSYYAGRPVRAYDLVGRDGRDYGTVEWYRSGYGRIFNNNGDLIGRVTPPASDQ